MQVLHDLVQLNSGTIEIFLIQEKFSAT